MVATSTAVMVATSAARNARDAECRIIIREFHAEGATQTQQLEYAACVQRFGPQDDDFVRAANLMLGVALLVVLSGTVIGALLGRKDMDGWVGGAFVGLAASLAILTFSVAVLACVAAFWSAFH